jgi:hypothetical protein
LGQERRAWVASYEDGLRRLREIGKRRRQRGYLAAFENKVGACGPGHMTTGRGGSKTTT